MLNIPDLVNGATRVSWQLFLITVCSKIKETERLNYAFFVTDAAKQVFIGVLTLHEKLDFSLRICSVNVTNSVFGHI